MLKKMFLKNQQKFKFTSIKGLENTPIIHPPKNGFRNASQRWPAAQDSRTSGNKFKVANASSDNLMDLNCYQPPPPVGGGLLCVPRPMGSPPFINLFRLL